MSKRQRVEVTGQQSNLSVKARLDRLHRWAAGVDQVVHSRREPADAKNTTSPGRRRQRCLSDDQVHSLVEAYEAGVAINELAAEFHVHRTTVLDHVKRAGTKRRRCRQCSAPLSTKPLGSRGRQGTIDVRYPANPGVKCDPGATLRSRRTSAAAGQTSHLGMATPEYHLLDVRVPFHRVFGNPTKRLR